MGTEIRSQLLGGRYRLRQRIGSGGMAGVYLARDERLGRDVAVKLTEPAFGGEEPSAARIEQEARRAARLNHPNVVQVHDVGTADGDAYIVMELVDGRGLAEVIREDGPLCEREAVNIVGQVCEGLAAAHAAGIVHRDIKLSNLLVDETGRVRIADFGIARARDGDAATEEQAFVSAPYVSPEQVTGAPVDHRSDLYSLGVVLYELLTGRQPFEGDTLAATVLQRLHHAPEPPSRWVEVSPRLDAVVMRALSREPEDRFIDADAMAAALRAATDTDESAVDAQSTAPLPVRRPRRRQAWLVLAAIAGLLAAFWLVSSLSDTSPAATEVLVPDVSGMTVEAASRVLTDNGLQVGTVSRESAKDAVPGTVLAQTPAPDSPTAPGRQVDLLVAAAPSAPTAEPTTTPTAATEQTDRGAQAEPTIEESSAADADAVDGPDVEEGGPPARPGHDGTPPGLGSNSYCSPTCSSPRSR